MKPTLKRAGACLFGFAALTALSVFWVTRDRAATHPALADSDLPNLISVRDFYADTKAEWAHRPSFDGQFVAWRGSRFVTEVVFFGKAGEKPMGWIEDINSFWWDDQSNHLLATSDGRLWKIDPLNSDEDEWVDITPRGFRHWTWPMALEGIDDRMVVASRDRNPAFSDLYMVDRDGSNKELIVENDGQTLHWILDTNGLPVVRFQRAAEGTDTIVQVMRDGSWEELFAFPVMTTLDLFEVSPDVKSAFAISSRGRDKAALVKVDLTTGLETLIYEEADEDLTDVINFSAHDDVVDAVVSHRGDSDITAFSQRGAALAEMVSGHGSRVQLDSVNWTGPGDHVTVNLVTNAQKRHFHLFNLTAKTQLDLGDFAFHAKHAEAIVPTEEITIPARDGLQLPALLMRPKGVNGPVPLIVKVHGGPAAHRVWEYHHAEQFLVNRGYAVLVVNFRGSTGFGKAFQEAGFKAFGRAMQDDLVDAALWAVDQGIADPDALAVVGASYGGYASAMAVLREDNPFSAAIIEHAMLDVAYQSNFPPYYWGLNLPMWHSYFGDPANPDDLAQMQALSPNNLVENLDTPVLLVAGKRDRVVGFEQSEVFVRKAKDNGINVELLLFEDEGHGLEKWQSNVLHARKIEDFLHEVLGGRSGGQSIAEKAAEFLD
ncbi:MAG: alpha/beta fold hydrolase [Cognatishimia sp.]|uniref:alpha/beta fold hydrolase n=1 Tax=Cognatishimia sp. TaxID=2211648 RepID=UPI00405834D0